jgi:hypothetical protein
MTKIEIGKIYRFSVTMQAVAGTRYCVLNQRVRDQLVYLNYTVEHLNEPFCVFAHPKRKVDVLEVGCVVGKVMNCARGFGGYYIVLEDDKNLKFNEWQ